MSESTELMVVDESRGEVAVSPPSDLFGPSPKERLAEAKNTANLLAPVVREKNLSVTIQGREHVKFEGWTLLGSLLGVFPVTDYVKPLEDGFEARVVAKTLGGAVVGAAVARCTRSEGAWRNRDDFALSSMAQTRAGAKALRMPLGFIMQLAGYDATPAEEMGGVIDVEPEPQPPAQPRRSPPAASPPPRAASSGGGRVISDKQRKRLYAISMSAAERIGVSKDDINAYMKFCIEQLGLESSKDLTKEPYDALCDKLERLTIEDFNRAASGGDDAELAPF